MAPISEAAPPPISDVGPGARNGDINGPTPCVDKTHFEWVYGIGDIEYPQALHVTRNICIAAGNSHGALQLTMMDPSR